MVPRRLVSVCLLITSTYLSVRTNTPFILVMPPPAVIQITIRPVSSIGNATGPNRMQEARTLSLALTLWLMAIGSTHADPVVLHEGFRSLVPSGVEMLRDPANSRSFDSLTQEGAGGDWQPASGQPSLGFTDDTVWLRFTLRSDLAGGPSRALLEIGYPALDEVDIYELRGDTLVRTWNLGDTRPQANRPLAHRNLLVPVDFTPQLPEKTLLLRVRTDGAMEIPLRLWSPAAFAAHDKKAVGIRGAALGLLVVVMIAFLLAALIARARGFAYYLPYAACLLAYQSLIDGTAVQFLGIDGNWWGTQGVIIVIWLIMVSGTIFLSVFLDTEHRMPRLHKTFDAAEICLLLGLGASLLAPAGDVLPLMLPMIGAYGMAVCLIALYGVIQQVPLARSFLIGTLLLFAGAMVSVVNQFGLVAQPAAVGDAMLAGILMQAVALAWALSLHLKTEREAHRAAQHAALWQQEEALAAQQRLITGLEARVGERSEALWQAMRQLEGTNRQLADLSRRDGLTGAHNRRYFDERFPELVRLASRSGSPIAVLMLDIDHFKQLNDTRGHATGDECLRLIAATLDRVISRGTDLVARYGGEEFVVVLPDTSTENARNIAEALREAVSQLRVPHGKVDLKFSVSIGLVLHTPQAGDDGRRLLAEADAALYRAKQNGRNRVEVTFS